MPIPLCALILADSPTDVELILCELGKAGFEADWKRVETESDYLACLDPTFDIVLSDYTLLQFNGIRALQLMQERGLDIPFIVVSGAISEEVAVDCMKLGAADYVVKDRLARLGRAVAYGLEQKRLRDQARQAEEKLRESERRFRALIENGWDAISLISADGTVSYTSLATTRILGYTASEFVGRNAVGLLHPEDLKDVTEYLIRPLRKRGANAHAQFRCKHKDGSWCWLEGAGTNLLAEPSVRAIVLNCRDITERKQSEDQLRYVSMHDTLTNLYNRAYFEEEMAQLERSRQFPVSVVMMDMDRLKEVNDSLGHAAGDDLLRQAAAILRATFRTEDVIARIGGDEFAVLLPRTDTAAMQQVVERLRKNLADYNHAHRGRSLSLSLGAATADKGSLLMDALRQADQRMYSDKGKGNGDVRDASAPLPRIARQAANTIPAKVYHGYAVARADS